MPDLFTEEDLDQSRKAEVSEAMPKDAEEKKVERSFDRKLFIIDGYSLIYRSYFAHLTSPLTNKHGANISAYFGFFSTLLHICSGYSMDYIAVTMDEKAPTFRHLMYPEYKANRDKAPEDLHAQVPMIRETLGRIGIRCLSNPGFEADDVMASLVKKAYAMGIDSVMVTGDKDLLQLVDDHVFALRSPKKGEKEYRIFGKSEVKEEYGVESCQIVDYLSIIGDKADNVPGVRGLGEKGAVKLLEEYMTLDGIYRHLDMLPKGTRKKLEDDRENALLSKKLIQLSFDALPDGFDMEDLSFSQVDFAKGAEDFEENNCRSLVRRTGAKPQPRTEEKEADSSSSLLDDSEKDFQGRGTYEAITEIDEVRKHFEKALGFYGGIIAFDTETTGLEDDARLVGFSFSYEMKKAYYVPIVAEGKEYVSIDDARKLFDDYLASGRLRVVGQNIKYDLKVLWSIGSDIAKPYFDTMLASWLLDSNSNVYNLDELASRYLEYTTIRYEDIVEKGRDFSSVKLDNAVLYGAEDSDLAFRLYRVFEKRLGRKNLLDVLYSMEMPLIRILARMERNGILLSSGKMESLKTEIDRRVSSLVDRIYSLAGHEFNINSTMQLSKVLFEERNLEAGKRTQKGFSTNTATLEGLRASGDPIVECVLEYRQLSKLKSTYIDVLPSLRDDDGRIHTSFLQTGTATGRLSSRNPNLQNIPVRTDEGRMIRGAFIPSEGCVFLSADYSQIELVVLAHMSGDENLRSAFNSGSDVHRYTASMIFSKDLDEIDSNERRIAKTINFGIMYGMSAFRLSNELGIPRSQASDFIKKYFERYSGIKDFVDRVTKSAAEHGFVRTECGHIREVPGITSSNKVEKAAAERVAVNTVIQGTAAEIMKKAMLDIYRRIEEEGLGTRMLLQVHDELIFEVPLSEKERMEALVRDAMESAASLSVPLRASLEFGSCWGDMH